MDSDLLDAPHAALDIYESTDTTDCEPMTRTYDDGTFPELSHDADDLAHLIHDAKPGDSPGLYMLNDEAQQLALRELADARIISREPVAIIARENLRRLQNHSGTRMRYLIHAVWDYPEVVLIQRQDYLRTSAGRHPETTGLVVVRTRHDAALVRDRFGTASPSKALRSVIRDTVIEAAIPAQRYPPPASWIQQHLPTVPAHTDEEQRILDEDIDEGKRKFDVGLEAVRAREREDEQRVDQALVDLDEEQQSIDAESWADRRTRPPEPARLREFFEGETVTVVTNGRVEPGWTVDEFVVEGNEQAAWLVSEYGHTQLLIPLHKLRTMQLQAARLQAAEADMSTDETISQPLKRAGKPAETFEMGMQVAIRLGTGEIERGWTVQHSFQNPEGIDIVVVANAARNATEIRPMSELVAVSQKG